MKHLWHTNILNDALNRTLKNILINVDSHVEEKVFGGVTMALKGDFKQMLPMVYKEGRQQIVDASLINAAVWKYCQIFKWIANMCLQILNNLDSAYDYLREFAKWVLGIGNGTAESVSVDNNDECN